MSHPEEHEHPPCVVVGAGPVGLIGALALARRGMSVVVLEAESRDRVRPGSRAIVLMYPTTRRLDQVVPRLGKRIRQAGIEVQGYDVHYGDRRVFGMRGGSGPISGLVSPGRWTTSLPQRVTEQVLFDECIEHGVEFRWESGVSDLHTDADGVTIELVSGQTVRSPYVIGADGARSAVRKAIGVTMEGHTDRTPFIIVDVAEHPDGSTPKMSGYFHYNSPAVDGRNVMHMPFAGGMRIDLQCLPTDDAEYMASQEGVREWTSKVIDPWYGDHVEWVSSYVFHQVVADSYTDQHRRVLLAGEAAHLFAPWGGRGLNSGVLDATDAATAIAEAQSTSVSARARRSIEQCANARRDWGLRNRAVSTKALRVMRGEDQVTRAKREIAARLAPAFWPAGAWLANGPLQLRPPPLGTTDLY